MQFGRPVEQVRLHDNTNRFLHDNVPLKSVHAGADGGNDIDRWGELRELGIPARLIPEAHGGMGLSDLLGLHYWFKRCGTNRQWLGVPEFVREEANVLQGLASA